MRIRAGGPPDGDAIFDLLDSAVTWLAARGRTDQWGTEPFARDPGEGIGRLIQEASVWIAEHDEHPIGALLLTSGPRPPLTPAPEPEVFVALLVTDHSVPGTGAALLDHARAEARRAGIALVRVDCYAGGDGALVDYYVRNGFTPVRRFQVGDWPGMLLEQRLTP
ncbi:GNAT family N-acetyltransferase [Actinomadura rayongensis]|uniref:GNAT family N-acetyltransferase n=1 Tax=Actinomadura rayongensis TaxID=1429076 RepID=A0A6I4WB77_9ACTN|nr:GNAT family N-acetyltransferase [Actinomadura rayongensis]MXQ66040.1 GNAT family N-acetyltransferase [Actinomadura rayongensis]